MNTGTAENAELAEIAFSLPMKTGTAENAEHAEQAFLRDLCVLRG